MYSCLRVVALDVISPGGPNEKLVALGSGTNAAAPAIFRALATEVKRNRLS
jgi:hypothetical protein